MQKGIWQYNEISDSVDPEFRLTLDEGNTELEFKEINGRKVFFKHEEQNPNKSFKDRSLAYWLSYYNLKGLNKFVISSSGNAAVSAIAYSKLMNATLKVFVAENIPDYKYQNLLEKASEATNIEVSKVLRPKSDAVKFAVNNGYINLRGSVDDLAIKGFETLGIELFNQNNQIDAVFICCSSGASTVGLYKALKRTSSKLPQIHIVQTTKINPIASEFDTDFIKSPTSLANAVSDKVAKRKISVSEIVKITQGSGWVISDEKLEEARSELVQNGIEVEGYNAYVSYAGYKKAIRAGNQFDNPVCIISGI